jgi:pimeloyl-ACP methyl ester carboxylesterase
VATTDSDTPKLTAKFVDAGGMRIHLHDGGSGPALVLLHGGGPGASGWSNFKQNVRALSVGFRLLIIDQPGYGASDKPEFDEPYYVLSARAVRDTLDVLGIEKAHFIGNSLGGGTALRVAIDYPERTGRLVLMGPGGASISLFSPSPSEGIKHLISFYNGSGPSREKMAMITNLMTYADSFATPELIEERYTAAVSPGAERGAMSALRSIARTDQPEGTELWRRLATIDNRTLLIWGRDDRTVPLDGAFFMLRQMPDAELHVFPRCGHWAQLEHQAAFDRLVIDFLTAD